MIKNKEIVIDGLRVKYLQNKNIDNNLTVVLPGWRASADLYKKILPKSKNFIILDWPGFAGSQEPNEVWGIQEYSDFLKKFLEKLNIEVCVLMGHSVGGSIAIYFADKYPEKIKNLILIASSGIRNKGFFYFLKLKFFLVFSKIGQNIFKIFPKKMQFLVKSFFYKIIGSEYIYEDGQMKKIFQKLLKQDLQKEMSRIKCSTYLIWGNKDKSVPLDEAYRTKKLIKNSELIIVENAGHYPFLDNYKEWRIVVNSLLL